MIVEGQETYTRQRNIQSCCAQEVKSLNEERRARSEVLEPNDEDNIDEWIERYPTALYLRLVVRVVTEWRSFDTDYEKTLPVGVPMLIDAIYQEIEVIYGPVLCRRALSLITFSKGGVSDGEMEDLLSMDDAVLGEVFQYSDPGVQRLPSHVWSRIRSSLMDLIKMEN